jgi:hypothetical protein
MSAVFGIIIGLATLLVIAFPERFLPVAMQKKKRIGITYWGFYKGNEDCKPEETMLVDAALTGSERVVAGSSMYAKGHGVKVNATK